MKNKLIIKSLQKNQIVLWQTLSKLQCAFFVVHSGSVTTLFCIIVLEHVILRQRSLKAQEVHFGKYYSFCSWHFVDSNLQIVCCAQQDVFIALELPFRHIKEAALGQILFIKWSWNLVVTSKGKQVTFLGKCLNIDYDYCKNAQLSKFPIQYISYLFDIQYQK
ncbi:unnamed protein product (macronuclear) [Paramecium tetraurelia]|uniref:Transmembrane protein n=1 Tax=Paramecium tetraurelia TaxID=5888 RepID=A0CL10_PARTE|nr:uncharacterized protein GSPATT00008024001 [Paramecium tetraurelia]CAK71477.1 unnamed protein product [Paramecium tetraurelia]|eukprot:XP_001438874.1 hypothetical protein (macronuclear) [Paramecium tetraurelia strain d4-2]